MAHARKRTYTPQIDRELDLHGCTAHEAAYELAHFFTDVQTAGATHVRIIVGKGTHSADGPILPDVVKRFLNQEGYAYTYAKQHEGGEGALVVRL